MKLITDGLHLYTYYILTRTRVLCETKYIVHYITYFNKSYLSLYETFNDNMKWKSIEIILNDLIEKDNLFYNVFLFNIFF